MMALFSDIWYDDLADQFDTFCSVVKMFLLNIIKNVCENFLFIHLWIFLPPQINYIKKKDSKGLMNKVAVNKFMYIFPETVTCLERSLAIVSLATGLRFSDIWSKYKISESRISYIWRAQLFLF